MSLQSFLHAAAAPAPPRITIRRRLLGRGSRLRAAGLAAGLLGLGLTLGQPAHAAPVTWDGVPADWFSNPSHWSNGSYPAPTDDALNSTTAAMTLGQSTTVNSFLSDGAFTLNGGTFSGNKANAASTLQVNNVFTLNGGQINNFTLNAGTQQAGQPAPAVLVNNVTVLNSVVNANLNLVTNPAAFANFAGANTVNGAITLGTTSNGLQVQDGNATLTLGSAASLTGFGNVFQGNGGATLTNGGLINATGGTLSLALDNFSSGGTLEATNGGTLTLANANSTNTGALKAVGAGSVVSISGTFTGTGTAAGGNLITATGGGQVQVNGATLLGTLNTSAATALVFNGAGNTLFNATVNGNLDLATNKNAFANFAGFNTVNGAITLGTTSNGLQVQDGNATLTLGSAGSLTGSGSVFQGNGGANLINSGTINANNASGTLSLVIDNFTNAGTTEATNGGTLTLNANATNMGALTASGAKSVVSITRNFASGAGNLITASNGGQVQVNGAALTGTLNAAAGTALIFNGSTGNTLTNMTINSGLDLSTNVNAFANFAGANTVNGAITLGTTSNGLQVQDGNATLTLGSTGSAASLSGFGSVFQGNGGATLANSAAGTINANATGKTLSLALDNFTNAGTTEATNGGTLTLANANSTNTGALKAVGAGSVVSISNNFASGAGNLITASGGGQVQVNGASLTGTLNTAAGTALVFNGAGNTLTGTTVNGNLDLATNKNAFANFAGFNTVNGAITLGTTSNGLQVQDGNATLALGSAGSLTGSGSVFQGNGGATLTNGGTLTATGAGKMLTVSTDNFSNSGTAQVTNGATLTVNSGNDATSGTVNVQKGGTANFNGLTQTAGLTQVDGVLNLTNNSALTLSGAKSGGALTGSGQIVGNVANTNGTVNPGDSVGTLGITGNFTQGSGGTLDIEFNNSVHDLLNVSGLATTGGTLDVNYLGAGGLNTGATFAFLDYGTLASSISPSLFFSNESANGTIVGHNGFTYMVINDTANKSLDLQVTQVGAPAVPEASTTVSFGLLLALGMGGLVVAARRKKAPSAL